MRMCVGCRERKRKDEMVRFARGPGGNVFRCEKRTFIGRGFYLCPDVECFKKAKRKALKEMGRFPDLIGINLAE